MTREENIATLNEHLDHWKRLLSEKICDQDEGEKTIDALQNAIKALEQEQRMKYVQETVNTIMNVCSTDSDTDIAMRNAARFVQNAIDGSCPEFEKLPPVSPMPKIGRWILQPSNKEQGERDFIWWKCSECGQVIYSETEQDRRKYHAYCGMCGCKMQEVENGKDND